MRRTVHSVQLGLAAQGRAIDPGQFRITLVFLGAQPGAVIPVLGSIANSLSFQPCTLLLDRLGTFGRAGVLWLGSKHIPRDLQDFQRSLLTAIDEAGIEHDRKAWKLHLTLYRRLRKQPCIMNTVPVPWLLNGFSLIESVNLKSGVEYRRLGYWNSKSLVN